jgi:hypothetical protein
MAAMIVTFGTLFASIFASNFYLGQSQNAIETHKIIKFRNKEETSPEAIGEKVREAERRVKEEVEAGK